MWSLGPAAFIVGVVTILMALIDALRTNHSQSPMWTTIRARDLALAGTACLMLGTFLLVVPH